MATADGCRASQQNLDTLQQRIGPSSNYRSISHFYHVTKTKAKQEITESKKLCGFTAKLTRPPSSQSPIHGKLSGVFFSCRLSKRGSSLPNISPFGSERIKIPIASCVDSNMHLFYNSHHHTKGEVCYAILVLVREGDPNYKFCQDHMIKLNMTANRLIYLDLQQNVFKYCDPSEFSLWVELFVVGDVPLTDTNHTWDTVTETGRNKPVQQEKPEVDHNYDDEYDRYLDDDYDYSYSDEYNPDNDEDAYMNMLGDDSDLDDYHDDDEFDHDLDYFDELTHHNYGDDYDLDEDVYYPGYDDD